jgi:hypothetical protein
VTEIMSIWRRSGLAIALAASALPALAGPEVAPGVAAVLIAAWAGTLRNGRRMAVAPVRERR